MVDVYFENREATGICINMNNEIKNLVNTVFNTLENLGVYTDNFQLNEYLNTDVLVKPNSRVYFMLNKIIVLGIARTLQTELSYKLNYIRYNNSQWICNDSRSDELFYNAIIYLYEEFTGRSVDELGVYNIIYNNIDLIDNAFNNFIYEMMGMYHLNDFISTSYELFIFESTARGLVTVYYIGDYRIKYYETTVKTVRR